MGAARSNPYRTPTDPGPAIEEPGLATATEEWVGVLVLWTASLARAVAGLFEGTYGRQATLASILTVGLPVLLRAEIRAVIAAWVRRRRGR